MKKRLTALFLGLCLVLSLTAPCLASEPAAAEAPPEAVLLSTAPPDHALPNLPNDAANTCIEYTMPGGGRFMFGPKAQRIISFSRGVTSAVIPSEIRGIPVKYIGTNAFATCRDTLKSVTFPDTLEIIYDGAFNGCKNLTEITLPDSLRYIEYGAFEGCTGLRSVTLGKFTSYIGANAFYGCTSLQQVNNTRTLTFIGSSAFNGCSSLREMDLSLNTFYGIASNAFANCTGLQNFRFPKELMNQTEIEAGTFRGCTNLGRGVSDPLRIPDGITAIGERAFKDCESLTRLELPSGVTSIKEDAFANCSRWQQDAGFLSGVTTLGKRAFQNCRSLSGTLSFPQSNDPKSQLKEIPESAFENCSGLTGPLIIPDSVRKLGAGAFSGCTGLSGLLRIPYYIQYVPLDLGENTFKDCSGLDMVIYANNGDKYNTLCNSTGNEILKQIRANGRAFYENVHPPYILSQSGGATTVSLGVVEDLYNSLTAVEKWTVYIAAAARNSGGKVTGVDIQLVPIYTGADHTVTFQTNLHSGDLLYFIRRNGYQPVSAPVPIL